jgi:ABC-type sugar transport system substrate-binding protein
MPRTVVFNSQTIACVVVAMTSLLFVGCKSRSKQIAVLTPTTGVVIWDGVHAGAVLQGRGCGISVRYNGPPRDDDLRTQLSLFERASNSHYAAIVVAPIQMEAFRDPVERVSAQGTPVVVVGGDLGIRNPNVTYVMTNNRLAGRIAARKVAEVLHDKGQIAIMGLDFRQTSNLERELSFEQELSNISGKLEVVQRRSGTTNLYQEQQTAEDLLGEEPHIDALVALTSASTRGALYAMKARQIKSGVHIMGFDQDLLLPIVDREIDGVVGIRANEMGRLVGRLVCDRLEGKEWNGSYTLPPVLFTADTLGITDIEQQLHGGGWWLGER